MKVVRLSALRAGRLYCRWDGEIKMEVKQIWWKCVMIVILIRHTGWEELTALRMLHSTDEIRGRLKSVSECLLRHAKVMAFFTFVN
jgi:hypothetical protein